MQSVNVVLPRDESTKILHEYLQNNYYKNIISLSIILMFSMVFNLIYYVVDSFVDKEKHCRLALEAYERYESQKLKKIQQKSEEPSVEQEKDKISMRQRKIQFTIWSHRNLQISFIHSVLCSIWLLRVIFYPSPGFYDDLLSHVSWETYLLVAFSSGYFLYDLNDIYASGYAKIEWVVVTHHLIVLLTFSYHMMNLLNVGYTVIALFMEFNSVFLHARKLLKFYSFKTNSIAYIINSVCNFISFVLFRFGVIVAIFRGMLYEGHRVTTNYLIMLGTCSLGMAIINVVLFKRLLIKDWSKSKNKIKL